MSLEHASKLVARAAFRKFSRGMPLPFNTDLVDLIDHLVEKEPSLELNGLETPLSKIRKDVEKENRLTRAS